MGLGAFRGIVCEKGVLMRPDGTTEANVVRRVEAEGGVYWRTHVEFPMICLASADILGYPSLKVNRLRPASSCLTVGGMLFQVASSMVSPMIVSFWVR